MRSLLNPPDWNDASLDMLTVVADADSLTRTDAGALHLRLQREYLRLGCVELGFLRTQLRGQGPQVELELLHFAAPPRFSVDAGERHVAHHV
jgi:hypothetical protein